MSELKKLDQEELIDLIEQLINSNKINYLNEVEKISDSKIKSLEEYFTFIKNGSRIIPSHKMIVSVIENEILNNLKSELKKI